MIYDVIIVGAGPAGLLTGCILKENGLNFVIIEKGKEYTDRNRKNPFDVSYGFGGAGLFSDGKLSYSPSASKLWTKLDSQKLQESYEYVKSLFHSMNIEIKDWDPSWIYPFDFNAVKHYESKNLTQQERYIILQTIYDRLHDHLIFGESVSNIRNINSNYYLECESNQQFETKALIVATGKYSSVKLFSGEMNIKSKFCSEMGVRLEVKNEHFYPSKESQIDYKLIEKIDDSTERRTFCCCKDGEIRKSFYENHITYNGEIVEKSSSGYSNIGVVLRTYDSNSIYAKEMENSLKNSESKVISIDEFGNGIDIIGRETDILLKQLINRLVIKESNGKIYGPEIEKYGYYPHLDTNLCSQDNLYFIGDSTGIFRGLMAAFISGVYVGLVITEALKLSMREYMNQLNIKQSNTSEMKLVFTAQSKAFFYCRDVVCQYVLEQGFLPINPFRVFDYFLSDRVDRELIRRGNNQLIRKCDELWVFGQIADGVLFEIASAIEQRKRVRFYSIGTTVESIREIGLEQISFEPEVHARQVKKTDLISFIKNANIANRDDTNEQLTIFDFLK